jgi:hypothetical protein
VSEWDQQETGEVKVDLGEERKRSAIMFHTATYCEFKKACL